MTSAVTVDGDRIELHYVTPPGADEALLENAHAREGARLEVLSRGSGGSKGLRRVEADWIHLEMRENGEEIRSVATLNRGQLDLLPESPDTPRRKLVADKLHWLSNSCWAAGVEAEIHALLQGASEA